MAKKKQQSVNILELTPIAKYEHQVNEDNLVDVLVPRFKSNFMQKLVLKSRSPYIRANLDEVGSNVWLKMDGKRNVHEIANIIEETMGEKAAPVFERLNVFFTQLHNNGFIYFKELSKEN